MSQEAYQIDLTIQVISGTPLTASILQAILMELARSITSQTDGQISIDSFSFTPIEVLH